MNIDRFHQSARYARKFITENHQLYPMVVGFNDETGEEMCLITPWTDDEEKAIFCHLIRMAFALYGVNEYHFMSEAWMMATAVKGEEAERVRKDLQAGVRVSEMSGRREILVISGISYLDPVGKIACYEILRDESGKLIGLGEGEVNTASGGLMLELLPPLDFILPEEEKPLLREFFSSFLWTPDFIEIEGEQ